MNEKDVLKKSLYLFVMGCFLFVIIGILFKDISYLLGFVLGYFINIIVFMLIMKMSDEILKSSTSTILIVMGFILKLAIYALGFYISVKTQWVHILGVFLGYLMIKLTIYVEGFIHKGGDIDG